MIAEAPPIIDHRGHDHGLQVNALWHQAHGENS